MKKLFIFSLLFPFLLISCSTDDAPERTGKATIHLNPSISVDIDDVETRATSQDYKTYTLILEGPGGKRTMAYPTDNKITDLDEGNYTITVTSHPDGLPNPAFDVQVYSGTAATTIKEDEDAYVTIVCKQINAGVFFVYHTSLEDAGLAGIVPTLKQGSNSLIYEGSDKLSVGYFSPGTVELSLTNDSAPVMMSGNATKQYTIAEHQLWRITLKVDAQAGVGGVSISVTVDPVTEVTNNDTVIIDTETPEPGNKLEIEGSELANATDAQKSQTTELVITGDMPAGAWKLIGDFTAVEQVTIRDFAGRIPNYAFYDYGVGSNLPASLRKLEMPKVTEVGQYAIMESLHLETIDLPEVTWVDVSGLSRGKSVTTINIPKVQTVSKNGLEMNDVLTVLNLPELTSAGEHAFSRCFKLTGFHAPLLQEIPAAMLYFGYDLVDLTLPEAVTLGANAFSTCRSLPAVDMPKVTTMGNSCFAYCASLATANLPNVETMGTSCFTKAGLTSISLPKMTAIPNVAFNECINLRSVEFGIVTSIGDYAFCETKAMEKAYFPEVETVGRYAFQYSGVKEIDFPIAINLGEDCFANCTSLTKINLPKLRTSLSRQFQYCESLEELYLPEMTMMTGSLKGCTSLRKIDMPKVTYVGTVAFQALPKLVEINMPELTSIDGQAAFSNCTSLQSVHFPKLTEINGSYLFDGCSALESVSFPLLDYLTYNVFQNCRALKEVKFGAAATISFGADVFTGCPTTTATLYLNAAGSEYASVNGKTWKGYTWGNILSYQP